MYRRSLWTAIRFISIAVVIVGALLAAPMSVPVAAAPDPPAFESMAENSRSTDGYSLDIPMPSGTTEGDLLVAILAKDGGLIGSISTPSGWTQIDEGNSGSGLDYMRLGVFYKVAGPSEAGPYTISWTSLFGEQAVGAILRYSGADTSDPIDVSGSDTGSSSTPTAPSVTTTVADTRVLRIYGADDDDLSGTPYPLGLDGRFNLESNDGDGTVSAGAADATQVSAGATDTAAFSLSASEQWRCVTVAIKPAAPSITIVKQADPEGPQVFDFAGDLDPFSLTDDGTTSNTIVFTPVISGTYAVTETVPAGWRLTDIVCDDPETTVNVETASALIDFDFDLEEHITCTFANEQLGSITIVKEADPEALQEFDFTGDLDAFSLTGDGNVLHNTVVFTDVISGTYAVTETVPDGWRLTGIVCETDDLEDGTEVDEDTASVLIDLDPGEEITCTFFDKSYVIYLPLVLRNW